MIKKIFGRPQLFYLAIISFGLAFGFNLQLSNLSSLFKFLGANGNDIPMLWLGPPLTGMLVQPLVGQISDDTMTRYGKRRPFIVIWGILAAVFFCVLPILDSLIFAVIMTWLIDCSLNGSNEALRALTSDITSGAERTKAFGIQAVFAGIGAAIGAAMPYLLHIICKALGVGMHIQAGTTPLNLKLSFVLGGGLLLLSVLLPMRVVKEKPYTREALLKKQKRRKTLKQKTQKILKDFGYSIRKMPHKFRTICLIHAVTWAGVFMLWLYFSLTVAQNIYGLPVNANTAHNAHYAAILEQAALDSSLYFTIYQYVSVGFALLLSFLPARVRPKLVHTLALLVGGLGMISISFAHSTTAFVVAMLAVGVMWGSMLVLPYSIVTQTMPKGKVGIYLGLFNISITLPQIICGLVLGPVYSYAFGHHAKYILILGGALVLISSFLWLRQEYYENGNQLRLFSKRVFSLKLLPAPEPVSKKFN